MDKSYVEIGRDYVITKHDLMHKLGRGTFADVYKCKKLINGQFSKETYVAKKIHFRTDILHMDELIRKEIEVMFKLTDDNKSMVKIYDHFKSEKEEGTYIIMEYCEGGDLDKYVEKNGPLTEREIADLLLPVAESFAFIHGKGVIHRDLKLANILLAKKIVKGEKPCIKITDFGLAHVLSKDKTAQTLCGTPVYMAPEIWNNDSKGYSNKIDVWAFGNMIYKMMYGEYAFEDRDVDKKVKEGIIRFPKLRFTSIQAMDLMLKCFRKNPQYRISFADIASHPFFTKNNFNIFYKVFDGHFGYYDTTIDNKYDLLKDPNCLKIPYSEPTAFELHNSKVLQSLKK